MTKFNLNDTIAAVSTSLGDSGIGIVRISGKDALEIADKVFVSGDKKKPSSFKTYTVHYGWIVEGNKVIDEVILTVMRSPKSYTREDVVEINCHGGLIAQRAVLELALKNGCRLADPGEFTRRAFLNGRIDLSQAEAVLDIIRAKTDTALNMGLEQLKGAFSGKISRIREAALDIACGMEADIDFPEDAGKFDLKGTRRRLEGVNNDLKALLEGSKRFRIFREGVHVVICGRPNVGKSSLLNALLRKERSIVTSVAGTTRDTIEEIIDIKGIPVRIVDTAGILEPRDLVEKKAVERSKKHIDLADLVILLFDGNKKLSADDRLLIKKTKKKTVLAVVNKIDLKQRVEKKQLLKHFPSLIEISAKKSNNIGLLEEAIVSLVYGGKVIIPEPSAVANLRHTERLRQAQKFIAEALNSLDNGLSAEFIAQDIKEAVGCLDDILGLSFNEDILDKIFSEFCIGK